MKISQLLFLPFFVLILASACSKEVDDNDNDDNTTEQVVIDFNIIQNDQVAPAIISTENLTTGYSGNYEWIVNYQNYYNDTTFSTSDFSYNVLHAEDFKVTLIAGSDTLTKQFSLNRPSYVVFDKLTLRNISNTYNEIYFKIKKFENSSLTTIYTSPTRNNVTPTSVNSGSEFWTFTAPYDRFEITEDTGYGYFLYFYDENDSLIASTNPYIPYYTDAPYTKFEEKEEEFITSSISCSGCDYLEAVTN